MWSEQKNGENNVVSGHPTYPNSSAAALLSYDIPHHMPWDWRVSMYTWTKGIAAGAYLVALLLVMIGVIRADSPLWIWAAPIVSGTFLAVTGGLLLWDLEHPERFLLIFTRSQWRSWLVRGAYIIAGYSIVLLLHFLASLVGSNLMHRVLMVPGLPLAAMTAVYTAYLFAQAKARDLWQNPLLPPHLLVQSIMVGAAALAPVAFFVDIDALNPLLWVIGVTSIIHLLMILGETTLPHSTAHAHLAVWEMTSGRYRAFFWAGTVLSLLGVFAPWLGLGAVPPVLVGLLLFEHAYVQAGQAVPLA